MSFELEYAQRALENIVDENAREAVRHLCKALEETNRTTKQLQDEVNRLRAYSHSH